MGTFLAALLAASPAALAATSAVSSVAASPNAFVPDWDGHSDSTVISYALQVRSAVVIRIVDERGRVVASLRAGIRDAGTHQATWDGRDASGRVQPPGTYALRVDATPAAPAPGEPDAASLGGDVAVSGARAATVTLRRADVVLASVALSRTAVGGSGATSRTSARFQLSAPANVAAAIVDDSGRVVRTLATKRLPAGPNELAWDGRATGGTPAADGAYALVVSANNGGRPTDTFRVPLSVDRSSPTSKATSRSKGSLDGKARVRFPITVTTSERGAVEVRVGRRSYRIPVDAGTHRLVVDGARLGLRPTGRARTVSVQVRVVDAAGNGAVTRTSVVVPRRGTVKRPAPNPTPPPTPTPPAGGGKTPAAGAWPWPIDGIVTSEFGLRNGRPHTGIDIGAPQGTPIHPIGPGTVTFVGQFGGYGNLVIVEHADGMRSYYAHMVRFGAFAVGATVNHLDTIGYVGSTGNSSGPHLHLETRVADTPRNPRAVLSAR